MEISSQLVAEAAKRSLIAFTRLTHLNYQPQWYHKILAEELEKITRGENTRLIISMPPRHGKTELASLRFAPWYMAKNPHHKVMQGTYSKEFAEENSSLTRSIVNSPIYQQIFRTSLSKETRTLGRWRLMNDSTYYAAGAGGAFTGRGANVLVIDDPHKNREEAESLVYRNMIWNWFASTAYTRLEKNGAIIIIMTRWHEDDLVGRVLQTKEKWKVLSFPAIAESDELYRKTGEALWPEKYDLERLGQIKNTIGSREFASLYQQRPTAAEGQIFLRHWWKYYPPFNYKFDYILQSWDTAFKKGAENDYSVCTTWGVLPNGYYLINVWRARVEFPELKKTAVQLYEKYNPNVILVEDKASGQSLIQELERETRLPIKPIKIDSDKITRANVITPTIEFGKVFLPSECPEMVEIFIDELATFPNGVHDDQVDSTTQALAQLILYRKDSAKYTNINILGR